ncbi:MAG TPA: LysR family transcriptional regulator [Microlunatus sp.]|nr:LysR family transcriptional regulator [Microlunatus sp.]
MDFRQMHYLVTLADEEQFTRAAAICGVSQSGLSAAIRALEDEFGTPLFERTTRRIAPTAAGLALLPHARTLLAQAAAARDAVVRATRELSGSLRVGAEQCLGIVDVVSLLDRVHRRYPLVDLDFAQAGSHELVSRVREGTLDLAFVATDAHLGPLTRIEFGRRPMVLVVAPEHPLAKTGAPDWSDLRHLDFVDFQESWAIRSHNDTTCADHGVTRHLRCTVNDVHTLLDLVHRGLGAAIVPQHVAAKPQAAGLVTLPMPASTPDWIVSAVVGSPSCAATSLVTELLDTELALSA